MEQSKKPIKGMIRLPSMLLCNLKPTKFTIANIKRKPTLPAVEMLSNCNKFAIINVAIAVINNPMG